LRIFTFGLAAFLACLTGVKSVDRQLSIEPLNHGRAQRGRLWFFRFGKENEEGRRESPAGLDF
jgi:hypothetical protein